MKQVRHLLTGLFMMVATLFAAAQDVSTVPIFTVPSDSIRAMYMSWYNTTTGTISTFFNHHYIYKKVNDTAFIAAPVHSINTPDFWWRLNGLEPDTTYIFASVINDNGIRDTSEYREFTTDTLAGPLGQFQIRYTGRTTTPFETKFNFHYDSDYLIDAQVDLNAFSIHSASLFLQGSGDTSIVAPQNMPGDTFSFNVLHVKSAVALQGVSDTFIVLPNYRVPTPDAGQVVSITTGTRTQKAITFTVYVKPGNTGFATVHGIWRKGTLVLDTFNLAHHGDTVFTVTHSNLPSTNTSYSLQIDETTAGGTGSMTASAMTLRVVAASISICDTLNSTSSTTNLIVTYNTNGSWDSSSARVSLRYKDRDNNDRTVNPSGWFTGPTTVHLNGLTNLWAGDERINNGVLYVENFAGMCDSLPINFYIASRKPVVDVYWGHLVGNVRRISVIDISVTGTPSNPVDVFAFVRKDYTSMVDTYALYTNLTSALPDNNEAVIGGLIAGDTVHYIRIATRNMDNRWYINSTEKWEMPIPGIDPIHTIAPSEISVNGTTLSVTAHGHGNGNNTKWTSKIVDYGTSNIVSSVVYEFVGANSFTVSKTITNLPENAHLQFISTLSDVYTGNDYSNEVTFDFWTGFATGINEAAEDEVRLNCDSEVEVYNVTLLQREGTGKYGEFAKKFSDNGFIYTVRPLEEKLAEKYGTKKVMFK